MTHKRTPKPPPTAEQLAALDRLTDTLPTDLRRYRDRDLINEVRRFRIEESIRHRTRSIVVVLDGIHDPHNQAAVIRTVEALGLQEIHSVTIDDKPFRPSPKVTQNANIWLDVTTHQSFSDAADHLRARGYEIWAAGFENSAVSLHDLEFDRPIALVFGNEAAGLSDEVRALCDGSFVIPLSGFSQSLNVSVAAAVTLWWAADQRAKIRGGELGDLDEGDRMELRRRFYRQAAGFEKRLPSAEP